MDELLGAAAGKSKSEIEVPIAQRFPRPERLAMVRALPDSANDQLAPAQVGGAASAAPAPRPKVEPVASGRYAAEIMMDEEMREDLRYAQALLGHQVVSGDHSSVFGRALKSLIGELEKRAFGAGVRQRAHPQRSSSDPRHVPKAVRRRVWLRDHGQCTFQSESGQRCPERSRLELDHIEPVARGGEARVDNLRLRCRAHNQYDAERAFGAGFMNEKRNTAQAAAARRWAEAREATTAPTDAAAEVIPYLRHLGMRSGDARAAAAQCESIPDAPLEERVRAALKFYGRRLQLRGGTQHVSA